MNDKMIAKAKARAEAQYLAQLDGGTEAAASSRAVLTFYLEALGPPAAAASEAARYEWLARYELQQRQ